MIRTLTKILTFPRKTCENVIRPDHDCFRVQSRRARVPSRPKSVLFFIAVSAFLLLAMPSPLAARNTAVASTGSSTNNNGGVFNGQQYSGIIIGGLLYQNNTFPFQEYAQTSSILALPAVSTWLDSRGFVPQLLRPYLSLYPSQSNPYDFSQAEATENGTTYYIYEYLVTGSSNGPVIGIWVPVGTRTVAKIFEYSYVEQVRDDYSASFQQGAGHEVYDTQLTGSNSMYGGIYYSTVFSDLSTPSSCNPTYCWLLSNWIGVSNYYWITGCSSNCFFFQGVLRYWGGNIGSGTACNGGSYSTDCAVFEYVLNSGSFQYYWPGVGS